MNLTNKSLGELFNLAAEIGNKYQDTDEQLKSISIYEYRLTVSNFLDKDSQNLTATFDRSPSFQDWQDWLSGWFSCGYSLASVPSLIRTI